MNEIKMEERSEIKALCELIANELFEIKMHICNERYFEGGVGLGGLISSVLNRQFEEEKHRRKNEEVQKEESNEECEESSEEEDDDDDSQDSFYSDYLTERDARQKAEKKLEEVTKFYKDLEKKTETFEGTKRAIFELQDIIMRLIKFKKIDQSEVPHVINILRNTGVEQGDIKVLCNIEEPPKKPRK